MSRGTAAWLGDDVWGPEEQLRALWSAAVSIESIDQRGRALRVRNSSAITMKLVVREAPEWLVITPPLQLNAESTTIVRPQLTGSAPSGDQRVELTIEVTNLHTGPGKNLLVKVPLIIR